MKRNTTSFRGIADVMRLLSILFLVPLVTWSLWGLDPHKPVDQYRIDRWQIAEGMPSNAVQFITQTPDGYLWLATQKGLVRFDGLTLTSIQFLDAPQKGSRQTIRPDAIHADRSGTLWISSAVGLTSYDSKTRRFKTYTSADGLTQDLIRTIKEDMNGNLWLSFQSSYVNRFANNTFTVFNDSHGLKGKKVNMIYEDRKGRLLFGTSENGIFIYKDDRFSPFPGISTDHRVTKMCEDWQGNLWIGTNKGLFRVNEKNMQKYTSANGLSSNNVTSVLEDKDRNLWVGTEKGLNRYRKQRENNISFSSLLKKDFVLNLYEANEGNLWVATYYSGLIRLKDAPFYSFTLNKNHQQETLASIFQDRQGDTLIGTLAGKLLRYRGTRLVESIAPPELSGTGITAIGEDTQGKLWLGTIGKGVKGPKNHFTTANGLSDNQVTSIYRDSRGDLWFSTYDGLSVFRSPTGMMEILTHKNGLSGKRVHSVYEDKKGHILVAADKGITLLKGGKIPSTGSTQQLNHYLEGASVSCIYEDTADAPEEGSVFWAATNNDGLKRFTLTGHTMTHYNTANGMTTNVLYRFVEDTQGYFWFMSDSGILRVNKSELIRVAQGKLAYMNCRSFGKLDGLQSLEFNNSFSRNSNFVTRDNQFWFITRKGISILDPDKIILNKTPPPLVIEEILFNREPAALNPGTKPYSFEGELDVSIRFTAPTFLAPHKVTFKYRLKGLETQWNLLTPGNKRIVHYKNLRPGTYSFNLLAGNAQGIWNRTGKSFRFRIKPRFQQTLLFKLLLLLLVTGLLITAYFFFNRYKRYKLEKKEGEKYQGSNLNPQFVASCVKKLKHLMEVETLYRDETLTLHSLSKELSIQYYQLSQILNETLKNNFSDYINSYRIEEAKEIMVSPEGKERKIQAIAYDVGFNTMTAFYKAFKKHTGLNPSQYKTEKPRKN
jgi:ligand-binding sensor domain-containing protein/AraC-like DNA-binding protein